MVDLDPVTFFDRVKGAILMSRVATRVIDTWWKTGSLSVVRSAFLGNIELDDLDKELARCGHRLSRYAGVYVRNHRSRERSVASITSLLTDKLRLKVDEPRVRRHDRTGATSRSIGKGANEALRRKRSLSSKSRVRDITCPREASIWRRLSNISHLASSDGGLWLPSDSSR